MSEKTSMLKLLNERMEEEDIIKLVCNYDNKFNELEEENDKLQKENNRLNNIINEFEKWLENEIKFRKVVDKDFELRKALNILQELKGEDKE